MYLEQYSTGSFEVKVSLVLHLPVLSFLPFPRYPRNFAAVMPFAYFGMTSLICVYRFTLVKSSLDRITSHNPFFDAFKIPHKSYGS